MNSSHFRDLFNRHDLRWTKQREEVYAALAGSTSHPTAEELFRLVHAGEQTADSAAGAGRPGGNGISLATVYNTLEALVRCGLARRYPAAGNSAAGSDAPHGTGPGGAVGSGGGGGAGGGGGGGWSHRYDADMSNHAHLLTADGHVRDVPPDLGDRVMQAIPAGVIAELEERMGVRIERLSVKFVEAPPSRAPQQGA